MVNYRRVFHRQQCTTFRINSFINSLGNQSTLCPFVLLAVLASSKSSPLPLQHNKISLPLSSRISSFRQCDAGRPKLTNTFICNQQQRSRKTMITTRFHFLSFCFFGSLLFPSFQLPPRRNIYSFVL